MTTTLPDAARALLDAPEQATIATVEPDGQPQLSPVWVKRDGDDILFSTTRGRRKPQNIERTGQVSVLVWPKEQPYSYLEVRGSATVTDDPARHGPLDSESGRSTRCARGVECLDAESSALDAESSGGGPVRLTGKLSG